MVEESDFSSLWSLMTCVDKPLINLINVIKSKESHLLQQELGETLAMLNNSGYLTEQQICSSCLLLVHTFYDNEKDCNIFWAHIISILDTILSNHYSDCIWNALYNRKTSTALLKYTVTELTTNTYDLSEINIQNLKSDLYKQNTLYGISSYIYVGIPRFPAPCLQSESQVYSLYSSNSISLLGDAKDINTFERPEIHYERHPEDVAPIYPSLTSSFMYDPYIELVDDNQLLHIIIKNCLTREPTDKEREFMSHHSSLLITCIKNHVINKEVIINPDTILSLLDHWKELGISFLIPFFYSEITYKRYFNVISNMTLTINRLEACIALLLRDLLPSSIISNLITKLFYLETDAEKKELIPVFCRYILALITNKREINPSQYREIDSFCRSYAYFQEAQEILKKLEK